MSSRSKGKRNEARARKILEDLGYEVEVMNYSRFGHQDFFNLWDLIAVKGGQTRWVQVKTNGLNSAGPAYRKLLTDFPGAGTKELWIFYDRKPQPRIILLS
jgi:Holliday junction resolvase-like predicted endonuclease